MSIPLLWLNLHQLLVKKQSKIDNFFEKNIDIIKQELSANNISHIFI